MNKRAISSTRSKISKNCRLRFEKNNNFGLIKDKNVSIHKEIQTTERKITNLKFFNLLNI
tara:strand:+ start:82 stop:261 length:180 start_codon:yes stop_codon:yes gene_type:complete